MTETTSQVGPQPDKVIDLRFCFGAVALRHYDWIQDTAGRLGERYERIEYDRYGHSIGSRILEPVCWLSVY